MKKKILSIFLLISFVFPSFFVVACKSADELQKISSYTYSIVLKNAKDKIDKNSLKAEYDYIENKNIDWAEDGNDYKISVTKSVVLSGNIVFSLLEGYDFSNLTLKVNEETANFSVISDDKNGVANAAYLSDRQLNYSYEKMKSNTNVVFDFSDCGWAEIKIDVSDLIGKKSKYSIISKDFVSLTDVSSLEFSSIDNNSCEITANYGDIIAFVSDKDLVSVESSQITSLKYSTYGSRYAVRENTRLQYFTATSDSVVAEYSPVIDNKNNSTLRTLAVGNITVYASEEDFQLGLNSLVKSSEIEYYDGNALEISSYRGETLYLEFSQSDYENYLYYIVDDIDEKQLKSINENIKSYNSSRKYYELTLSENDSAKYLLRKPRNSNNYYLVCTEGIKESTQIMEADYIIVGTSNNTHTAYKDKSVLYGYKNDKNPEIYVNATESDVFTDAAINITGFGVNVYGSDGTDEAKLTIDEQLAFSKTFVVDCKGLETQFKIYCFNFSYTTDNFKHSEVNISTSDLKLYSGEKIFVTTDISDNDSWRMLEINDTFNLSSQNGETLYFYFLSNRVDAGVQIVSKSGQSVITYGEDIALIGDLTDCFERKLAGQINIGDDVIDLSKVQYLELEAGYYDSFNAYFVREYDRSEHSLSFEKLDTNLTVMVSVNGSSNKEDYVSSSTLSNLKISSASEIYYYIRSDGYCLTINNSQDTKVGDSEAVYIGGNQLIIDGCCVYKLVLGNGWWNENEEFYLAETENVFKLTNAKGSIITLYNSKDIHNVDAEPVTELKCNAEYTFLGEDGGLYQILDSKGTIVLDSDEIIEDMSFPSNPFTFKFSVGKYPNGETFILKLIGFKGK